jgi:hypothetical protein
MICMLSNWRHSGFQVFCGQRIFIQDETAMENLARYIIRASFSQERMQYLPEPSKVVYWAKGVRCLGMAGRTITDVDSIWFTLLTFNPRR